MNDEIKECLDSLYYQDDFSSISYDKLLDYITNLQQAFERSYTEEQVDFAVNEVKEQLKIEKQYSNQLCNEIDKLRIKNYELQQENEYLKKNNPEQNIEHFRIIKENKRKINNLREENKTLKEQLESVINENQRLLKQWFEDNDKTVKLVSEKECYKSNYNDYKSRCEKGIELIKNKLSFETYQHLKKMYDDIDSIEEIWEDYEFEDLLNTLQGENNGN